MVGVEPTSRKAPVPKTGVFASFTTSAYYNFKKQILRPNKEIHNSFFVPVGRV